MDGLPPTFLQCFEIPEEEMIKVTLTKLQPSVTTPRNSYLPFFSEVQVFPPWSKVTQMSFNCCFFRDQIYQWPGKSYQHQIWWKPSCTWTLWFDPRLDFSVWSLGTSGPWANTCHPAEQVNYFLTLNGHQIILVLKLSGQLVWCKTKHIAVHQGKLWNCFPSPKWEAPLG